MNQGKKLALLALAGLITGMSTGCKEESNPASSTNQTSGYNTSKYGTDAEGLKRFIEACQTKGYKVEEHECNGHNSCKGESFFVGKGVLAHSCTGKAECAGASCVEPKPL